MIPVNYLYFRDIINFISYFGAVAATCFVFWCVARIAVALDHRHSNPPVEIHHHYIQEPARRIMIERGDDDEDAKM